VGGQGEGDARDQHQSGGPGEAAEDRRDAQPDDASAFGRDQRCHELADRASPVPPPPPPPWHRPILEGEPRPLRPPPPRAPRPRKVSRTTAARRRSSLEIWSRVGTRS